jgi:hypothetical protein
MLLFRKKSVYFDSLQLRLCLCRESKTETSIVYSPLCEEMTSRFLLPHYATAISLCCEQEEDVLCENQVSSLEDHHFVFSSRSFRVVMEVAVSRFGHQQEGDMIAVEGQHLMYPNRDG